MKSCIYFSLLSLLTVENKRLKLSNLQDLEVVKRHFKWGQLWVLTGGVLSSVLVSSSVHAACTPAPDCASLGYTATSCPNGGVKCPFDTSKWHCDNPCDSEIYKYDCKSANETGGIGTACGAKYASCYCASGYEWKGGSCQKSTYTFVCCSGSCGDYDSCMKFLNADSNGLINECKKNGGWPYYLDCYKIGANYSYAVYECKF